MGHRTKNQTEKTFSSSTQLVGRAGMFDRPILKCSPVGRLCLAYKRREEVGGGRLSKNQSEVLLPTRVMRYRRCLSLNRTSERTMTEARSHGHPDYRSRIVSINIFFFFFTKEAEADRISISISCCLSVVYRAITCIWRESFFPPAHLLRMYASSF